MIPLMKNAFLREQESKDALAEFIRFIGPSKSAPLGKLRVRNQVRKIQPISAMINV